ncbi:hypothetical protein CEXT_107191 [Caerostris extrusa]|uniref:Uncharacterized protein n=1 Tax=Caerostris extrusa TaxID=172846 RepID=A0AAV4TCA8_CAEEX|nr:hypothetical protein CEXT_107191 [Caerostris extrusa]
MLVQSNNSAIPIDNKLMENLESSSMCNNIESNFTEDPVIELLRKKLNSFAGFPFSKNSEQWKGKLNQLSMLSKKSLRRLLNLLFIPWDDVEDQTTLLFKLIGHFEAFTEEEDVLVNFCEHSPVQKINAQHDEKNQVQFNGKEDLNLVPNASLATVTKKKKAKTNIVKNIEVVAQKQLPSFNRASSISSDASSEKCVGINTKQNIGVESSVMSSHSYPTLSKSSFLSTESVTGVYNQKDLHLEGSVTKKKKTKRKKAANSEPIIVHEIIKTDKNAEQIITKSVKVIVPW